MSNVSIEAAVGTPEAGIVLQELPDMQDAAERVKHAALNCVQPLLRNKGQGVASEALHLVQQCKELVPESNLQVSAVTTAAQRVVKALTVFAERLQEADRQAAYISPAHSFGLQGANPSYAIFKDVYDSFEQLLHDLGAARQHGDTEHVASTDLQREYPTGHEVSAVALSAASCDGQGYLPGLEVPMLVVDHTLGMRAPYSNLWVGSNQGMELYVGCSHRGRYDMPFNDKGQAVTCAVADAAGRLWTGHADGTVRRHCLASWHTAQSYTSDGTAKVCAMAMDSQGRCWAGDEEGRIRVFTADSTPARLFSHQLLQPQPIKDITQAAGHQSLLAARTSSSSIHASSLRDHTGARITALSCISLAVITAGGDSPCSMCVWDSRSYQKLGSTSVDSFGVVRSFAVVPWGTASLPVPSSPSQGAFDTRTAPAEQHDSLAVRAAAAHGCDRWRLLSGHNSGQVLLWQISFSMDSRAARHPAAYEALQLLTIIELAGQPRCGVVGMSVFERVSKLTVVYDNGRLVMLPMPTATNGAVHFSSQQLPQAAGAARPARFLSKLTRRSKPASEKGKPLYIWSPRTACLQVQESNAVAATSLGELLVVASKGMVTSWTAEQLINKAYPPDASSAANPSAPMESVTAAHKASTNPTQPAARHHSPSPKALTGEPAHSKVLVGARDNYEPQTVLGKGISNATVTYAKHGAAAVCTAPNPMSPEAAAAQGLQLDSSRTVVLPQTDMGYKPQQGPAAYNQSIELHDIKQHTIIASELVLKEVIGSGAGGKSVIPAAPEPMLAANIGLAVGQLPPASSSAAAAMVTDAASAKSVVETGAVGPETQKGASSSSEKAEPMTCEEAEQLSEAAAAPELPQLVPAQAETPVSPPSAATAAALADAGRAAGVIAPTAVANLAGSASQTPSRSVSNVQKQIGLLEQLQPELSGLLMRLAVLYTAYAVRSAAMLVQQAQLLQYTTVEDQSSSAPQLQGLEQQQQALVLQLQVVQVLLEEQQLQAQLGRSQLLQIVTHFLLLHLALRRWSQDAAGSAVQYGFISSPSSKGAFVMGTIISAAAFLILWPMLSLSAAATIAAGVFAGCLLWLQQQQQCDQEQQQWQPPDLPESQILQRQVATAGSVSTQQGSHSFQVYSSLHDIPGSVLVGLQPNTCSSSVGYATWPAQWITGGSSAAASDCAVLLHSLPVHRFSAGCQQHGVALASAAPGEDTTDDTKVRDQGGPSLEEEFVRSGTDSVVPADSGHRGAAGCQQMELRQHHVLSSSTLSRQQPADIVIELLENLMSHQQAQHEQPGLQPTQLEPDGHTASDSSQRRPDAVAGCGRVLWVCLQPPLLLEELPTGSSLAAWLLWQQWQLQQQLLPVQVRQVSGLGSSEHTSDSGWMPPFSAALWPAVLTWLQQIATALAGMHARGIVHGGLHAGAVYLSKATADTAAALQQPGSSTDASSCSMTGPAVLSLAAPWQHAVTPGCVVDAGLAAPEVQLGSQHPTGSTAVDVYGFGMLMWQLATGWVPQEQQLVVTGPAKHGVNDLCIYDELSWCAMMLDKCKTTFPGAAAGNSSGSNALPMGFEYGRHGGLLGGCHIRGELVTSDVWLPVGYKQLMYECCRSDPGQRPRMAEVCRRATALTPLCVSQ